MSSDCLTLLFGPDNENFNVLMSKFGVTQEMLDENIERLKLWLKSQSHFCHVEMEMESLRRYLFGNIFSFDRAKNKIENLLITRALMPEMFTNRNANNAEIRKVMDVHDICLIPAKLPDNSRVIIVRPPKDSTLFDPFMFIKVSCMIADMRIKYETCTADCVIFDCNNITLSHFIKYLPHLKQHVHIMEECYGCKIKEIHIINFPDFAYNIFLKIKSMLKKKMTDRMKVHNGLGNLHEFIPADFLPSDIGGKQKSYREITIQWRDAMSSPQICKWFLEQENQKSDETKRSKGIPGNFNEFSGLQGTFRTLDID